MTMLLAIANVDTPTKVRSPSSLPVEQHFPKQHAVVADIDAATWQQTDRAPPYLRVTSGLDGVPLAQAKGQIKEPANSLLDLHVH